MDNVSSLSKVLYNLSPLLIHLKILGKLIHSSALCPLTFVCIYQPLVPKGLNVNTRHFQASVLIYMSIAGLCRCVCVCLSVLKKKFQKNLAVCLAPCYLESDLRRKWWLLICWIPMTNTHTLTPHTWPHENTVLGDFNEWLHVMDGAEGKGMPCGCEKE